MLRSVRRKWGLRILKKRWPGRFEASKALILTSSPRSGSTLLGQVLEAIPKSSCLFEPLNILEVKEAHEAGFTLRTYHSAEESWPKGEAYLRRVYEGRVLNRWLTWEIDFWRALQSRHLIVKYVRANQLLPWMCRHMNTPPPIILVRHPCAVVASQIKFGWEDIERPEVPPFLRDYPKYQATLAKTEGELEFLAATWALDQLVPLKVPKPHPWTLITYEELMLQPEKTLMKIQESWGVEIDMDVAMAKLKIPSKVVKTGISGIDGWKKSMTEEQVAQVLDTVRGFGLNFYSEDLEADYQVLHSDKLANQLHQAGLAQNSGASSS